MRRRRCLGFAALFTLAALAGCAPPEVSQFLCQTNADCRSSEHCEYVATTPASSQCESGAPCATNADCSAQEHCDLVVTPSFCRPEASCTVPDAPCLGWDGRMAFCNDATAIDVATCAGVATTARCRALSPALDANTLQECEPENACTTTANCRTGERCIEFQCRPDPGCTDDSVCGAGRACVRGECLVRCDADQPCPDVTTCTVGACQWLTTPDAQCPLGQLFYADRCHVICNADRECPLGFYCDAGLCALDGRPEAFRPAPVCTSDAGCAGGSRCVASACRAACPSGTDTECQRADVTLTHCDAQHVCRP